MTAVTATIPPKKRATVAELVARLETENEHLEIINGEIVQKAGSVATTDNEVSGPSHGLAMTKLGEVVGPFNRKPGGTSAPGGWWLFTDLHVGYSSGDVYAHDLSGFRRDRHAERPASFPVMTRPDWVCEILSDNRRDLVIKPRTLHAAQVPHYWVLDSNEKLSSTAGHPRATSSCSARRPATGCARSRSTRSKSGSPSCSATRTSRPET
jgi:Uma2 family endonuclease